MPLLHRSIVALILALPAPVLAQTVARADLVGTWVRTQTYKDTVGKAVKTEGLLSLNADSTWTSVIKVNGEVDTSISAEVIGKSGGKGRWYLVGDSLWLEKNSTVTGPKESPLKAALSGEKLFLLGYEAAKQPNLAGLNCNQFYCYERVP